MFRLGKNKRPAVTVEDVSAWDWVETGPTTMEAEWNGYVFRTEFHTFRNMHSFTCRPRVTSDRTRATETRVSGQSRSGRHAAETGSGKFS